MKYMILTMAILSLSGCGAVDRSLANLTGEASEVCQDGVLYLQFTSGTSVKYDQNGSIAICKKEQK